MERFPLDLNNIRTFAKVAELLSVSAAARAMGRPKSSVSRNLAALEEQLGVALVHRSTRQLRLTEAGAIFLDYATHVLGTVADAEAAITQVEAMPAGLLRINAPLTAGHALIAPLVPSFLERYPGIDLQLDLDNRRINLAAEDVDVVIRVGPLEDSSLVARKLATVEFGLYCSPHYGSSRPLPSTFGDLGHHQVVMDDQASGRRGGETTEWSAIGPRGPMSVRVRARLATNSPSAAHVAILQGAGIGWLPDFLAADDVSEGRLVRLLPEVRREAVEIHALFQSRRLLPPKVRVFLEFLAIRLVGKVGGSR